MGNISKGCLPKLITIVLAGFTLIYTSAFLYQVYQTIVSNDISTALGRENLKYELITIFIIVVVAILPPVIYGLIWLNFFPRISLIPTGLSVKGLWSQTTIDWDEILFVKDLKWISGKKFVIDRKGAWLLRPKGLFIYYFFPFGFQGFYPVILFLKDAENYDLILEEVMRHKPKFPENK
jgi:hypothetical protein